MEEQSKYNFPKCGTDKTQRIKLIYESGTSSQKTILTGIGIGAGGGIGVGVGGGAGISQSELARRLAPPQRVSLENEVFGLLFLIIISLIILVTGCALIWGKTENVFLKAIGLLILLFVTGYLLSFGIRQYGESKKKNSEALAKYKQDCAIWERLWFCHRCGHVFFRQERAMCSDVKQ